MEVLYLKNILFRVCSFVCSWSFPTYIYKFTDCFYKPRIYQQLSLYVRPKFYRKKQWLSKKSSKYSTTRVIILKNKNYPLDLELSIVIYKNLSYKRKTTSLMNFDNWTIIKLWIIQKHCVLYTRFRTYLVQLYIH